MAVFAMPEEKIKAAWIINTPHWGKVAVHGEKRVFI
jgi:hypothetical protein